MKRIGLLTAAGALVLGSALPALAQQAPPAFTVTFRGEFRAVAGASNNVTDFADTKGTPLNGPAVNKDSDAEITQRFRLWTDVMSGDKHAGATLGFETGDTTWGNGGGTSNNDSNGGNSVPQGLSSTSKTARTGNGAGGAFGADGVSVEVKHAFMWFDVPGLDNARLTIGIQNVGFLQQPTEFFSDDAAAIKFDWKIDPVAIQLWYAKVGENSTVNADDNDIWTARVWFKPTPDWTVSVEGMLWNQQCFSNAIVPAVAPATVGTRTGACLKSNIGDTFFIGSTVSGKVAGIGIDAGLVYGQRELPGASNSSKAGTPNKNQFQEAGWGFNVAATIPINPVTVTVQGWYTSGDKNRAPGDTSFASGAGPASKTQNGTKACTAPGPGVGLQTGCSTAGQNNSGLLKDSDRLPSPDDQGTWYTRPLIGELYFGQQTIGGPPSGVSPTYAEMAGSFGIGASAMLAITPSLTVGGGAAYIGATDADGLYGSGVFEIDGGLFYTVNANVSIQGVAGYMIPETGDNAWGAAVRTRFAF